MIDKLDWRILETLQFDFPLSVEPYEIISRRLQVPSDQVYERVQKLMAEGIIRRIGTSLDSRKLGFCSTLAAVSVEASRIEPAVKTINEYPEVTHSYLRRDHFNIWFTIIAVDNSRIEQILEQIRLAHSLESSQILNLPMKRLFKLDTRFDPRKNSRN